ncbi:MAG: hypothetical protein ACYC4R_06505 [Anaerolineae bacterium]
MTKKAAAQRDLPPCCRPVEKKEHGALLGLVYGLVPHAFCILFLVLTIVGATAATSVLREVMLVPYLFQAILALSVVFATASAAIYLRRLGLLSLEGARHKWRYLSVMYGATLAVNLLLFQVVFPATANLTTRAESAPAGVVAAAAPAQSASLALAVDIPCSGHAPLIISEVSAQAGVQSVTYTPEGLFLVTYDPAGLSEEDILALPIFESFPASVAVGG